MKSQAQPSMTVQTEKDELLMQILSYHGWRQAITLKTGLKTPGHVREFLWNFLGLPESLEGKSFLEAGSNDGMFSFMAERLGAYPVVASDLYRESIDSMKNGWSSEGIEMARDYLSSRITIHREGIYQLDLPGRKFDVVLINDVINWLEDIEAAFDRLCSVTGGRLYISDGFLTDNRTPRREKIIDSNLRFMYNLKYVEELLQKRSFHVESVRELNYQEVFMRSYIETEYVEVTAHTVLYDAPAQQSAVAYSGAPQRLPSNGRFGEFLHLHGLGWVREADVRVTRNQPSVFYRAAKSLGLQNMYFRYLGQRHKIKTGITAYVITARPGKPERSK